MANFDVSFLNPKLRTTSADYGFLIDQLDIKSNQLASDGKLSPGDYDLLIKQARDLYSHPGLTPAQRSNVLVKISSYKEAKSTSALKDNNDISKLNRELTDTYSTNAMLLANNPQAYLQSNADALHAKIDQLTQSINSLTNAGDDATNHINEYNDTLQQFNDTLQALDDVKNHKSGDKPKSNYVAYITTNSQGEISDIKVGRTGSQSGYVETNGLYGGLQIYGKVNRKEFGKNVFVLGDKTFQGSDLTIQDPTTPGAFRSAPLYDTATTGGKNLGVVPSTFSEIDPSKVIAQSSIRSGGWAQGSNGFLYQKLDNGKYVKYVNADKAKLGIQDNNIIKIPNVMEKNIMPFVTQTIDGSQTIAPPMPSVSTSTSPAIAPQSSTQQATQPAGGTARTPGPTERAPSTAQGIGAKVMNGAKGILGYIFGGGE